MIKITEFPHSFALAGETWELHPAMMRRITAEGIEQKVSLDGEVFALVVAEGGDEFAVAVVYEPDNRVFVISRQFGMRGPFTGLVDMVYDAASRRVVVTAAKDGKPGSYVIE
ncbi:hypothetical protein JW905_10660 [bacterium]|nr:hypothetical protein [candidate division CSSED10-310 bacterium]